MTQSHRDWVLDEGARRGCARMDELFSPFDAVICPIMPTPAYPHDHSLEQEQRRIVIDGKDYVISDQLAPGPNATLPWPARDRDFPLAFRPAGLPVGVQIVGPWLRGPHAAEIGRNYRARIRRLRSAPTFDD